MVDEVNVCSDQVVVAPAALQKVLPNDVTTPTLVRPVEVVNVPEDSGATDSDSVVADVPEDETRIASTTVRVL